MGGEQQDQHKTPVMPTEKPPSLPAIITPTSADSRLLQKSPDSFSSKSLGLESLDFGYNELVVGNLLPPSPGRSPSPSPLSSSHSNAASSVGSLGRQPSLVLSSHPQPATMPQCQSAGYEEDIFNSSLIDVAGINTNTILVPLKHSESHASVIDLVDIRILDEQDSMSVTDDLIDHHASATVSAKSADPKEKNEHTGRDSEHVSTSSSIVDIMLSTDHSFGQRSANFQEKSVESLPSALVLEVLETCDRRLSCLTNSGIDDQATQSRSPFAVRDIDELLAELGVAETFIFDPAKDMPGNRESFCSRMPLAGRPFSSDSDEFSLKEIDELIEQLETGYSTAHMSGSDNKLEENVTLNNTLLAAGSALQSTALPKQLDILATIHELGAVISPDCAFDAKHISPSAALDVSGLVSGLGAVIVPALFLSSLYIDMQPMPFDVASLICQLGRPEDIAPTYTFKSNCQTLLDISGLITELGAVIVPDTLATVPSSESESDSKTLHVSCLIHNLGSPDAVVLAAPYSNNEPVQRHLDIPDIIASLGAVYVPAFAASGINKKDKASIQTLFDDAISTSVISHFKPSGFESTATISANHRRSWALSNLPDMDVDEIIHNIETSRSRASSIATNTSEHPRQPRTDDTFISRVYVAQNDGISISRLMCALNIAPIFVRRPFLGPSRAVVFPHFY
ncbi:hypothetical protein IWW48_005876 [Coemansia sp. RSA 1200]|nr:hypothetical protein IWW48_005876 [Coemansia sp. RSA 1200]